MKTRITLTSLLLCLTLTAQNVFGLSYRHSDDTIVARTKQSVLIVAGKVTDLQYVESDGSIYTDVTIAVSKVLKGEPNIDDKTVRFRVEGDRGADGAAVWVSGVRKFPIGDELIFFIHKRDRREWAYDKLYPMMHFYPEIVTEQVDGQTHKFVWFQLYFFGDEYSMKLPVELAFRLIENAIEAPEEVALLEKKIRAIKNNQWEKIRAIKDMPRRKYEVKSTTMFLSMLEWELTQIEVRIKAKKPPPYVIDVDKLAGAEPDKADRLIKEMIPTQLLVDCRLSPDNDEHSGIVLYDCWEIAKGRIPGADAGRINSRTYSIGNGQITAEGETPDIILNFDEHLAPNVDEIFVRFRENVSAMDALRRLGYDPDKRIKQANWSGWYFITDWHVHRVAVENREGDTEVSVYLSSSFLD